LRYLRFSGRSEERVALVETYMKAQGLFHTPGSPVAEYTDTLELDLSTVEPSVAGPKRPQDRVRLGDINRTFHEAVPLIVNPGGPTAAPQQVNRWETEGGNPQEEGDRVALEDYEHAPSAVTMTINGVECILHHGSVVIAAITSCTNTSNPSVMVAAGLLAKKAAERGLTTKPWVKTSLAPGSKVVTEYLDNAGLTAYLDQLGFQTVGYGCTTCIGNSGPLPQEVSAAIEQGSLVVASVLSGNRNFEGRVQSEVKANYLMSPPLVVAYALEGRIDTDLQTEPLGTDSKGQPVYLRDVWPSQDEIKQVIGEAIQSEMFQKNYAEVFKGDAHWNNLEIPSGDIYAWPDSTYVKNPPYFAGMSREAPETVAEIHGARVLAMLGDSITTDHISPAGSIKANSPAGKYLIANGVEPKDFNSYGSRRGNDEVMVRGTFANVRLRNQLAPGTEGGFTTYLPSGEVMSIYDAAMRYKADGTPLIILAGKEYGSGSSRDWAAKGPYLLGVRAVIAESYERIHRSNLVGMGILPLQFLPEENVETLGITGHKVYDILGLSEAIASNFANGRTLTIRVTRTDGSKIEFSVLVRLDTPQEVQYYRHGGILQYALRHLLEESKEPVAV
ncbi:MAG: aconitate hydratase AcnA, partial [Chloroflexales bacterium]|nr:aconitate hydratase AcnA [Chloroflexales bacterium]